VKKRTVVWKASGTTQTGKSLADDVAQGRAGGKPAVWRKQTGHYTIFG